MELILSVYDTVFEKQKIKSTAICQYDVVWISFPNIITIDHLLNRIEQYLYPRHNDYGPKDPIIRRESD